MYVTSYDFNIAGPGDVGTDDNGCRFVVVDSDHERTEGCVAVISGRTRGKGYGPGKLVHYSHLRAPITWEA